MAPNTALAEAPAEFSTLLYPSLASASLVDVLRLIRTPNVGPITFFQLLRRFGSVERALDALPNLALRGGKGLNLFSKEEAEKEIAAAEKFGARMIKYGEPEYPALLHHIPDAPPVINVIGDSKHWLQSKCIAMVGARNASANGCSLAQRLASDLGAAHMTIVSGLARGIDTFAHKGALNTGTVGVIAGGIDNVYPPENAKLFDALKEKGAIISEQPFGQEPFSSAFPGRNRIISGISSATIVVEASPQSGSLITARFANEQGREVFAVPGSPLDPRAKGCNGLIKQGAHMLESAEDVLSELAQPKRFQLKEPSAFNEAVYQEVSEAELLDAREVILSKLGFSSVSIDELVEQCALPVPIILNAILELELGGKLQRSSANKVSLRM